MTDTINHGGGLLQGEKLISHNSVHTLVMQSDGNLVLYSGIEQVPSNAKWSSKTNTDHPVGPYRCIMQDDGNLVVYDAHKHAVWASDTVAKGSGEYRLVMQTDGNLVIYDGHNKAIWATNTNH